MASYSADRSGPHIVHLMRKMHNLEEERKEVLNELSSHGAPGFEDRRRRNRRASTTNDEDFDLVAMWSETSETLQGVIAEREAQLETARAR
jgi:hypothetical protein